MTSLVEEFYGLKKPAFTVDKSSGPVLMTQPLRTAANFLRRELDAGAPLLCVTGPNGIGKSSVARALPKLTGGRFRIAAMSGRADSWADLRQVLTREFGLADGRITRDGFAAARARYGKLLIVVDDAQFLSPDRLERICILPQLQTDAGEPVTQVVLFADLDAVALEDARPLRAWFHLDALMVMEPLHESDVRHYTATRLQQAGWSGEPLFSESGALALHQHSLGNPRRLSAACIDVLEHAASRGLTLIDASFVTECVGEDDGRNGGMLSTPTDAVADDASSAGSSNPLSDGVIRDATVETPRAVPTPGWKADHQKLSLKAENFAVSPSLELADVARLASAASDGRAPLKSMRGVSQSLGSPSLSRPIARRRGPHPLVVVLFAVGAALALYASRVEVADALLQFGVNLPFITEEFATGEVGSDANATTSTAEAGSDRDTAALTLPKVAAPGMQVDLPAASKKQSTLDLASY